MGTERISGRSARWNWARSGQPIRIQVLTGPTAGLYLSRIEHWDRQGIVVRRPVYGGRAMDLPAGQACRVLVPEAEAAYEFETTVLGAVPSALPLIWLAAPKDDSLVTHRRRRFPRKPVQIPASWAVVSEEGVGENHTTTMTDISLGGARIVCSSPLPAGTRVRLSARASDQDAPVQVESVVRHSSDGSWGGRAEIGLEFVTPGERTRDALRALITSLTAVAAIQPPRAVHT